MELRRELNNLLIARTKFSTVGQITLTIILCVRSLFLEGHSWCIVAAGLIGLFNVFRIFWSLAYPRFSSDKIFTWYYGYSALTLITSVMWGCFASRLIYLYGTQDEMTFLLLMMVAGLGAGSTAVLTPDKKLARSFVVGLLLPLIITFCFVGSGGYATFAVVAVFNLLFLFSQINLHSKIILELHARRNQLQAFDDVAIEAIVVHDEGTILEVNSSFQKMFQYSTEELAGRPFVEMIPAEDRIANLDKNIINISTPLQLRGLRKDGSVFPVEITGQSFLYGDRQVRVTTIQDITLRKGAEEAIREREKNAFESVQMKAQFLANMSHEIRTPMNAIIGITDLLRETAVSEVQKKYFRTLKDSGESLLNLVNDILDFSKIDAGKVELENIEFSLASAVEGQVELLSSKARQQAISLEILLDPNIPRKVQGDYGRLGQILLNLTSNAIKFTKEGSVRVSAWVIEQDDRDVHLHFEIRDTGIGIAAPDQTKLFTPFNQSDSSMARKYGGTGLGLSICNKLVQLMNGEIGFESQLGRGTTFWFELKFPIIEALPLSSSYVQPELEKKSVLVLMDELPVSDVLSCYFESWKIPCDFRKLDQIQGITADLVVVSSSMVSRLEKFLVDNPFKQSKLIVIETAEECILQPSPWVKARIASPVRYSDLFNALNEAAGHTYLEKETIEHANLLLLPHARILVAEDNSTNQMIISALLHQFGVHCQTVRNGQEAVDAYLQGRYDLVLMDCQMPELDGYQATEKIRQIESSRRTRTPIVALTANVLKEDRDRCMQSGMDDFLSKPIRKEKLISVLEKFLRKAA